MSTQFTQIHVSDVVPQAGCSQFALLGTSCLATHSPRHRYRVELSIRQDNGCGSPLARRFGNCRLKSAAVRCKECKAEECLRGRKCALPIVRAKEGSDASPLLLPKKMVVPLAGDALHATPRATRRGPCSQAAAPRAYSGRVSSTDSRRRASTTPYSNSALLSTTVP